MEHLHTLQDFMLHTKGVVYLLIVAFLVCFVLFWKFLDRNREQD